MRRRQTGFYEVCAGSLRAGEEVVVLPDAVPSVASPPGPTSVQYGWVRGVLPSPSPYDLYLVRFFIPRNAASNDAYAFRVIAYVDRYARVFEVADPVLAPPARYPSLAFAHYGSQEGREVKGCVQTYDEAGKPTVLANYVSRDDEFVLFGSWYDFGAFRGGISLDEAISRAFFALVWRPRFLHKEVPPRDLRKVGELLRGRDAVKVMRRTSAFLAKAEEDVAMRAPAPARCLHAWLQDAGLPEAWAITKAAGGNSGVHLQRQKEYSNQFALSMDEGSPLPERLMWKLESALNRYEMLVDGAGERAVSLSMENCAQIDHDLRERFALQVGEDLTPADAGVAAPAGEWAVRAGIARAMEEALVPVRFAAAYRANVEEGIVAFEMLVPDADMAPASVWVGGGNDGHWREQTADDREISAREYAQRLGLMLAAIAARQSERIHEVTLTAEWFFEIEEDEARGRDAQGRSELHNPAAEHAYGVIVDCDYLRQPGNFRLAVENPGSYFALLPQMSEAFAQADIPEDTLDEPTPFWPVTMRPDYAKRFELPDLTPRSYGATSANALGCDTSAGLAINYNAPQRNMAERVARRLAELDTASEGIAALRMVQSESNDPDVLEACTRLMTKLAQGELRMDDQNDVVSSFLGHDRFEEALSACRLAVLSQLKGQSQGLDFDATNGAGGGANLNAAAQKAVERLCALVDETMLAGVFADDADTVYRVFDSSVSRIFYNLAQTGRLHMRGLTERVVRDNGKQVRLAPDSYYYCCVELVRLLERSFDRSDDALRYGREAVRLAPTTPAGYRQLARAYMLVGDLTQARDLLVTALRFAYGANEISWLYYQLAYVEWKAGRVRPAQACYLKAIAESVNIASIASGELREMLANEHTPIMRAQDVNTTLTAAGIPLAPTNEVMDALHQAGHAAVDEGAFLAARNVLMTEFHHRPDDVLVHVLRSLDR